MTSQRTLFQLREDARAIWQAGVDAVASDRLVGNAVSVAGNTLRIADEAIPLAGIRRITVVGAGKAGAGMAAGLEAALGTKILEEMDVTGWVNVPADCVRTLQRIHLHPARPPGVNEPTIEGVRGSEEIDRLVRSLGPQDVCIVLLSGGGSALLPAPAEGITLKQKQALAQHLSGAGANIEQLNTVRKQFSRIKGGGLARACRAGRLICLIISDVLGDPLDVIASGPTVTNTTGPQDALDVLERFPLAAGQLRQVALEFLRRRAAGASDEVASRPGHVRNIVIGNNAMAVDAAGAAAERRGYSHAMVAAQRLEGEADEVGRHLARMARRMREHPGPDCLITGGEPTVTLVDAARRGRGGRNQQLVLAALLELLRGRPTDGRALDGMLVLAGGTDGEDGPTDAAGAWMDAELAELAQRLQLDMSDYLRRNDAYHFFEQLDALIKTGPTHTNVCDLRVVLVDRSC